MAPPIQKATSIGEYSYANEAARGKARPILRNLIKMYGLGIVSNAEETIFLYRKTTSSAIDSSPRKRRKKQRANHAAAVQQSRWNRSHYAVGD